MKENAIPNRPSQFRLMEGDCMELMASIPSHSVDMILSDPPYGITARNGWDTPFSMESLWEQYSRIIKSDGAILLFGSGMFTARLMMSNPKMWRYNLIWHKTTPTGFLNAKRMPLRAHEDILVFHKRLPTYNPQKTFGHERKTSTAQHKRNCVLSTDYGVYKPTTYDSTERYPTSILTFKTDKQKSRLHPTQKSVDLLRWLIRTYSNENDLILDSFAGSSSTGEAALLEHRNFIGIEYDPRYIQISKERLQKVTNSICRGDW